MIIQSEYVTWRLSAVLTFTMKNEFKFERNPIYIYIYIHIHIHIRAPDIYNQGLKEMVEQVWGDMETSHGSLQPTIKDGLPIQVFFQMKYIIIYIYIYIYIEREREREIFFCEPQFTCELVNQIQNDDFIG